MSELASGNKAAGFLRQIVERFLPRTGIAEITGVQYAGGNQDFALATVNGDPNQIIRWDGTNVAKTEVWEVEYKQSGTDRDYRLVRPIRRLLPAAGADLYAPLPVLVVSTLTNPSDTAARPIGAFSTEDRNSLTGASGSPMAMVRCFYRTRIAGVYDIYDPSYDISQTILEVRKATETVWTGFAGVSAVKPSRPMALLLAGSLTAGGLSASVTLPAGVGADTFFAGYDVHWDLSGETVIGSLNSAGTTLTIMTRGADGTTAVAHSANESIELNTGACEVGGLEPGIAYQLHIIAVNGKSVQGPPSDPVNFTAWKRTVLPATASVTVEQREAGLSVSWPVPLSGGLPITDPQYVIYRNTTATTSGATTIDAKCRAQAIVIPGSRGSGNYIGVKTVDSMGNESSVVWGSDTQAPNAPSTNSWDVIPNDYSVEITYTQSADSANATKDPGFRNFVLYRADSTTGTNATLVKRFGEDGTSYAPPLDKAYYYQVVSEDWVDDGTGKGNISARVNDDQHWKIGLIGAITDAGVINGNFQKPGPARTVGDAVGTASSAVITSATALFTPNDIGTLIKLAGAGSGGADYYGFIWEVTSATSIKVTPNVVTSVSGASMVIGGMPFGWIAHSALWTGTTFPVSASGNYNAPNGLKKVEHLTSGGVYGQRVLRLTFKAADYSVVAAYCRIGQFYVKPVHSGKTFIAPKVWVKGPAAIAATATVAVEAVQFSDDFGQTYLTTGIDYVSTPTFDGNWHEYSMLTGPHASARSMRLMIAVQFGGNQASDVVIDIDDVTMAFS